MEKLIKRTHIVKRILQEVPVTRVDDGYLLLEYYRRVGVDTSKSFKYLVLTGQIKDLESVTRCRRKVQEQFPDLKVDSVDRRRREKEEAYVHFAMDVNRNVIDNPIGENQDGTNTCN